MELRHLRYFLAVAEELNFTRAASRVGIGQPPLSQQIKDLEQELGVRLFDRLPYGVELTEAGNAFLVEARAILGRSLEAGRIARRAAEGKTGRLRLGYAGSTLFHPGVPAIVRSYGQAYPGVDLSLHEAPTAALLEAMRSGQIDGAFLRPGKIDPSGVQVVEIDGEPMMAALPDKHPLARRGRRIPLQALAAESFLIFPRNAGAAFYDEIVNACRNAGFEPRMGQQAPQLTSVSNLVAAGLGIAIVPASLAVIRTAGVKYLALEEQQPVARLVFASPSQKETATMAGFLAVLNEWLATDRSAGP